ncbi:Cell division protein FtsK [Candidatus Burkholderia brachyanthoides]|nr:Cell division protein FtsK [Candidatus Burkholderia brachyanthoides]
MKPSASACRQTGSRRPETRERKVRDKAKWWRERRARDKRQKPDAPARGLGGERFDPSLARTSGEELALGLPTGAKSGRYQRPTVWRPPAPKSGVKRATAQNEPTWRETAERAERPASIEPTAPASWLDTAPFGAAASTVTAACNGRTHGARDTPAGRRARIARRPADDDPVPTPTPAVPASKSVAAPSNVVRFPIVTAATVSEPAPSPVKPDLAPAPAEPAARAPIRGFSPTEFEFHAPQASAVELPTFDLLEPASDEIEPVSEERFGKPAS